MMSLLSPAGTSDRTDWWIITIVAGILAQMAGIAALLLWAGDSGLRVVTSLLLLVAAAGFLWLQLAVTIRRLHDRGYPWWSIFLELVPVVGWIWLVIECGFLPGSTRRNPALKNRVLVRRKVTAHEDAA